MVNGRVLSASGFVDMHQYPAHQKRRFLLAMICVSFIWIAANAGAQLPLAPALPEPDARYKADILVIVPHPDDTTLIDGYLARASLDEHRRVAVIFATTGESGSNSAGPESGVAMGQEMILESHRGLESGPGRRENLL